jgi:hypothetical protein
MCCGSETADAEAAQVVQDIQRSVKKPKQPPQQTFARPYSSSLALAFDQS